MTSTAKPQVAGFFDSRTSSIQYVVWDPDTMKCAIIDPVLDFDPKSGSTSTSSADEILNFIWERGLSPVWILDTHPHADHFSASSYLKQRTGARNAIGAKIVEVQKLWKDIYNIPAQSVDGGQWDVLFEDGDQFELGNLSAVVMYSPGHTLASVTYVIGDAAFIHDTLFMPDSGTARADFPGGSARSLWSSIQRVLTLPDDTRLFVGHDYQPCGRALAFESTVLEQRSKNIHLTSCKSPDDFVELREKRDSGLPIPALMLCALLVNINGGRLPAPEDNGRSYLKIPLNALSSAVW